MSDGVDSREALLAMTPDVYLRNGYCDAEGRPRAELLGEATSAAATQLVAAEASPQELAFTYEALRILLPRHAGPPQARAVSALAEALGTVARMIRQPNNEGIEAWCRACVIAIRTEADIAAWLTHTQATLRIHALLAGLPSPEELASSSEPSS